MAIDMGMDFGQLANIARPQMMPNAPIGAGAMAGADYGEQRNRQNMLLQQATEQAKKEAEYKAAMADEEISPEAVAARRSGYKSKVLDEEHKALLNKKLQAELDKAENQPIQEAANIYAESQDINKALQHLKASNKLTFKNHRFGIEPKKDEMILEGIFTAAKDTPQLAQKLALKELDNEGKYDVALLRSKSKESGDALRAATQLAIQKARDTAAKDRADNKPVKPPTTMISLLAQLAKQMQDDPDSVPRLQPEYDKVFAAIKEIDANRATAAPNAKADQQAAAVSAITQGKINLPGAGGARPPVAPAPAATDKFTVGKMYKDAKGNTAKYLGNGKWETVK